MKLAIQVITYKSSKHLRPLLASLKAQTFRDFEIWFLDNSADAQEASASRALVETSGLRQHFIISETNSGFSGGHTRLYAMHDAPFVMLLNDDVKLEPGYLAALMERIESDPKIGSVSGLVCRWQEGETTVDSAGMEYRALGMIVERYAGRRISDLGEKIRQPEEVYGATAAVGIYRRSAIDAAGGLFDPAWFMYKEDVDLAIRLHKAGFVARYEPAAVAWHKRGLKEEGGWIGRILDERKRPAILRRASYVNQWRIYKRHFSFSLGWRDIMRTIFTELGRSVLVFLASPKVFFLSWYDIARA